MTEVQQPKKIVLSMKFFNEEHQEKAFEKVASIPGIKKLDVDRNDNTVTIITNIDPSLIADKVGKYCLTRILRDEHV
ncbi:putative late blight resistance protein homolog R1B-12 [Olea europaea var. sylvestris]|uniref:putative late blight resistance protein homolog R1B-12 n=1 Tax=Olea europaea var. sylvestris TaxID=158386 RepID=UPI000C1D72DB|nr:putative late blight resistance protein homolog R1B-12 [Olea europaea var. sylvestris]